jgi:hypothetical protein
LPIVGAAGVWLLATHRGKGSEGDVIFFGFYIALLVAILWRLCVHPRIRLNANGMDITKIVGKVVVPWSDIRDVKAESRGLTVTKVTGQSATFFPIFNKTNITLWFKVETRSDRVARWVLELAHADPQQRLSLLDAGVPA